MLPLAVAGCSSSAAPVAATSAASRSGTSGITPTASADAGGGSNTGTGSSAQLTGTRLQALMITGLQLPAGFTTDTSQDTNSGATLENPEVKIDIATMSCAELAAGNTGDTGFGETAEASSTAVDGADESIDQGVTQFPTTAAAQSFYTAIYAKWFGCRTFTATSDGGSGTGTMTAGTAPTGVGQEAFAATITGQYNGVSSVTHLVGAVEGTDLYLVAVGAVGDSAPTDVDPAALTRQLIANVGRG